MTGIRPVQVWMDQGNVSRNDACESKGNPSLLTCNCHMHEGATAIKARSDRWPEWRKVSGDDVVKTDVNVVETTRR